MAPGLVSPVDGNVVLHIHERARQAYVREELTAPVSRVLSTGSLGAGSESPHLKLPRLLPSPSGAGPRSRLLHHLRAQGQASQIPRAHSEASIVRLPPLQVRSPSSQVRSPSSASQPFSQKTSSTWAAKESSHGNAVVLRGPLQDRRLERSKADKQLKLMTERHCAGEEGRYRARMWAKRKRRLELEAAGAAAAEVEEVPAGPTPEELAAQEEKCRQRRKQRRRRKQLMMQKDAKDQAGPRYVEHIDRSPPGGHQQPDPDSEDEFDSFPQEKGEFQICMELAVKHHVDVAYVRECLQQFRYADKDRNGTITMEEFKDLLHTRCDLEPDQEVPKHLLWKQWKKIDSDCSSTIDFEEYLVWYMSSVFSEDLMVPQTEARRLRQLARDLDVSLLQVERVKTVFDKFDADHSGEIDKEEFVQVLCDMMKVKDQSDVSHSMLMRYWREVDFDNSGSVDFEEFLVWYIRMNDKA